MDLMNINNAKKMCQKCLEIYPGFDPLISISKQLTYLESYEKGNVGIDKLIKINIGLIAAREIEQMDMEFANILYNVQGDVDKILNSLTPKKARSFLSIFKKNKP